MPSRKPTQERIDQVKTQFQVLESKVLESSQETGKEKHFKLLYDTALEAVDADLSKTAYRLWIYLSANYPFSDREVDLPSQTELGIRLGVTRQAINIASAELQTVGLWDFWAERWKGRNLKGFGTPKEKSVGKTGQVSKKDDTVSKKDDTCKEKMTPCQKEMTLCQKEMTPTPPEPLPQADSKTPQTIQTSSDFIQTLSEGERENESFEKFCRRKIDELPQRPNNPKAYIRKYREDYLAEWQEEEAKRKLVEAQIEASKPQTAEQPKTAEQLNKSWHNMKPLKATTALKAIEAEARELGYEVTGEGIFDAKSNSSSEVNFPPPGTGFELKRE